MTLRILSLGVALLALAACPDATPTAAKSSDRWRQPLDPVASKSFCEKVFPFDGPGAKRYAAPPTRPLPPSAVSPRQPVANAWTWVNLWATWCEPCRDEMPLLGRWKDVLGREGAPINLELLSLDEPENGDVLAKAIAKGLPGPVSWLQDEAAMAPFLEGMLQVDKAAALPIHALVDPSGALRCVRVGAVHQGDYGAVRALILGQ